VPAEKLVLKFC